MMTDEQLAQYLGIAKARNREAILAALTPEQRAEYELLRDTELGIALWQAGRGARPAGLVCTGRRGSKR